jgi:hypothetical protein
MEAHGERLRSIASDSRYPTYFTFGAEQGWTTKIKLRAIFPIMYILLALLLLLSAIAIIIQPDLLTKVTQT